MASEAPISFLPGFRFRPTDPVLLRHYLPNKIKGQATDARLAGCIMEADLYGSSEPDKVYAHFNISEYACLNSDFYFFTFVKKKSSTGRGNHMHRIAGEGTWKSQHPKPVYDQISGALIGHKTTLNFQINNKNINPSWIMHEYTLPNSEGCDHWAICRVRRGHQGKDSASVLHNTNKRSLSLSSAQNLDADVVQYMKKQCSTVACAYELGSSSASQPCLRPPSPPLANHHRHTCAALTSHAQPTETTGELTNTNEDTVLVAQPTYTSLHINTGEPSHGTTSLSQDEGLVCSPTEPIKLLQPTQPSTSSTECPAEPLNQCLTSEESLNILTENDLFTLDELFPNSESSDTFAFDALDFDTYRVPELHTDVPPNSTTCLPQDEGLVCSTPPINQMQPAQPSSSSTECPTEPLNQCLTREELALFLLELDDLSPNFESSNGFAFEELNYDIYRVPGLQNQFIEIESYGGILLS